VFNICDGLGIAADDPRGLTLTGGLPFFGGAGNNYSMHAIAETVQRARQLPGSFGFVGANGGYMSKYSAGVYSTKPTGWVPDGSAELQAEVDGWDAPAQVRRADGWAVIESFTVRHARDGAAAGLVVGRLEGGGERFAARGEEGDREILELLTAAEQPIGQRVYVRSTDSGNRVALSG
jgi:acetyl-CoA C-acetyltransferase